MITSSAVKAQALELKFDACGIAAVEAAPHGNYFLRWLGEGKAGEMDWMKNRVEQRMEPIRLLDGARSMIVLGLNYYQPPPSGRGRIATYALGKDYHDLVWERMREFDRWLSERGGVQKTFADTAPVLEKPIAQRSGLGWQGKSTVLIHKKWGTWLFLGEILTTLSLETDQAEGDHCGKCTRCVDACPTQAIVAPYQLDARRCIAYLTIEHPGSIPVEFRDAIGDRVYGCDECLTVCPWNRWAQKTKESHFAVRELPDLRVMLEWTDAEFRSRFRGTPIFRLKSPRWKRNICVVLGNIGSAEDLQALEKIAAGEDVMVKEHALWALEKIRLRNGTYRG